VNDPSDQNTPTQGEEDIHSFMPLMEKAIAYLSIGGALMVSNQFHWGWIIYLAASIIGMWWSWKMNYRHLLIMNVFFTVSNVCGIWNYILNP
jgi:hypothetical protein